MKYNKNLVPGWIFFITATILSFFFLREPNLLHLFIGAFMGMAVINFNNYRLEKRLTKTTV